MFVFSYSIFDSLIFVNLFVEKEKGSENGRYRRKRAAKMNGTAAIRVPAIPS
jgi:hypothetical protein